MACVHIYCGDGKGKTTAALGLALRAAGRGYRVVIARFLKHDDSGELSSLALIPQIRVTPCERSFGFYRSMSEEERREAGSYYRDLLERAWAMAAEVCEAGDGPALLVLDEIMAACTYHLVDLPRLTELLDDRPDDLEVVLTGRGPGEELLRRADYVSEIYKVRHPYDRGVAAREGIEY